MQLVAKSSKRLYIQTLKYNKTVTAHMYAWIWRLNLHTRNTHKHVNYSLLNVS